MADKVTKEENKDFHWYILSTRSGHEKKVVQHIKQRVKANGMDDLVKEILIPTQEKIVAKGGKKKTVAEQMLPGYVLINMVINDDTYSLIRFTDGVTGFLGQGKEPEPLSEDELKAILALSEVKEASYKSAFRVDEMVNISDGPFKDFIGRINEINEKKGQLVVMLNMFGREVPKTFDFSQVNKLSETE